MKRFKYLILAAALPLFANPVDDLIEKIMTIGNDMGKVMGGTYNEERKKNLPDNLKENCSLLELEKMHTFLKCTSDLAYELHSQGKRINPDNFNFSACMPHLENVNQICQQTVFGR